MAHILRRLTGCAEDCRFDSYQTVFRLLITLSQNLKRKYRTNTQGARGLARCAEDCELEFLKLL